MPISNASWLTDDIPSIIFGLRGVIHLRVTVQSKFPELHSGVAGGVIHEPLLGKLLILSQLITLS